MKIATRRQCLRAKTGGRIVDLDEGQRLSRVVGDCGGYICRVTAGKGEYSRKGEEDFEVAHPRLG